MTALLEYPDPDCSIRVSRSFLANSVPKSGGGGGGGGRLPWPPRPPPPMNEWHTTCGVYSDMCSVVSVTMKSEYDLVSDTMDLHLSEEYIATS